MHADEALLDMVWHGLFKISFQMNGYDSPAYLVVFVNDFGWYLFADYLNKYGVPAGLGNLGSSFLVAHFILLVNSTICQMEMSYLILSSATMRKTMM